jgi:hypothetical protein
MSPYLFISKNILSMHSKTRSMDAYSSEIRLQINLLYDCVILNKYSFRIKIFFVVDFFLTLTIRLIQTNIANTWKGKSNLIKMPTIIKHVANKIDCIMWGSRPLVTVSMASKSPEELWTQPCDASQTFYHTTEVWLHRDTMRHLQKLP